MILENFKFYNFRKLEAAKKASDGSIESIVEEYKKLGGLVIEVEEAKKRDSKLAKESLSKKVKKAVKKATKRVSKKTTKKVNEK